MCKYFQNSVEQDALNITWTYFEFISDFINLYNWLFSHHACCMDALGIWWVNLSWAFPLRQKAKLIESNEAERIYSVACKIIVTRHAAMKINPYWSKLLFQTQKDWQKVNLPQCTGQYKKFEFSLNIEYSDKNICHYSKRVRTCHLLQDLWIDSNSPSVIF